MVVQYALTLAESNVYLFLQVSNGKVQDDVNNNPEMQEYVVDRGTRTTYMKGKFLGKVS